MSDHFQDIFHYRKKIQEIPGLLEFPGHVHNLSYVLQVSYMRFVNFVSSNINKKKSCFFSIENIILGIQLYNKITRS